MPRFHPDAIVPTLLGALESLPAGERRAVADAVRRELGGVPRGETSQRHIGTDLTAPGTYYYAIHDADLQALREAGAVAAGASALATKGVGILAGLVVLLWKYYRKRVRLDARQGMLLLTLRRASLPGWSAPEILGQLPPDDDWTVAEVETCLAQLQAVILADGTSTALVALSGERWRAVDV